MSKNKKIILGILTGLFALLLLYPLILIVFPLGLFKIIFFPLWLLIQALASSIIGATNFDPWVARGIAISILVLVNLLLIRPFGLLLTGGYNLIFKKEYYWYIVVGGCLVCIGMSFVSKGVNFNRITGEPLKKYYQDPNGKIELFPIEINYDPKFGYKLKVITPEIAIRYQQQVDENRNGLRYIPPASVEPSPASATSAASAPEPAPATPVTQVQVSCPLPVQVATNYRGWKIHYAEGGYNTILGITRSGDCLEMHTSGPTFTGNYDESSGMYAGTWNEPGQGHGTFSLSFRPDGSATGTIVTGSGEHGIKLTSF